LACLLGALGPAAAQTTWTKSTEIWFNADNPKSPIPVFFNTAEGGGVRQFPRGRWVSVDLSQCCNVPPDAKQAFLSGLLLITGPDGDMCNLRVAFRAPGSTWSAANYLGQTLSFYGGQRAPMSTWVPLVQGKFEFHWESVRPGAPPSRCTYGVNLSLQAWTR
jgi:hypothetical protein